MIVLAAVIILAREPVPIDPLRFTDTQIRQTSPATREGLARWASTEGGRKLLAYFAANHCEIVAMEDSAESGAGIAPQPGIATLAAASDQLKTFELILNPTAFQLPQGMTPLPQQPATAADLMAATWAAEMLHIYFYAQGISLPHHQRSDFQEQWQEIAAELGFPLMSHGDDDERPPMRPRRVRVIGRAPAP